MTQRAETLVVPVRVPVPPAEPILLVVDLEQKLHTIAHDALSGGKSHNREDRRFVASARNFDIALEMLGKYPTLEMFIVGTCMPERFPMTDSLRQFVATVLLKKKGALLRIVLEHPDDRAAFQAFDLGVIATDLDIKSLRGWARSQIKSRVQVDVSDESPPAPIEKPIGLRRPLDSRSRKAYHSGSRVRG